jgi:hypothetical protein
LGKDRIITAIGNLFIPSDVCSNFRIVIGILFFVKYKRTLVGYGAGLDLLSGSFVKRFYERK